MDNAPTESSVTIASSVGTPRPENRKYYLVRSSKSLPLESGLVGVGWDDFPFKDFGSNGDELVEAMRAANWDLGRSSNQIRRYKDIKAGDLIVVPTWGAVAIGEATGEEVFDDSEPYCSNNGSNQHRVRFPMDGKGKVRLLPRTALHEDLQRRLKIRITIADLGEFAAEIENVYSSLCQGGTYSRDAEVEAQEVCRINAFKDALLANIKAGRTGLQTGGVGMELLVRELLEADGLEAMGLSKQHFGSSTADADIVASKTHALGTQQFLVQVKHHEGQSDDGVQQLLAIHTDFATEYGDHELVLVTSGTLPREARELATKNNIILKEGQDLAQWILDSLPKLTRETRNKLGIMNVPSLYSAPTR